MAARDTLVTFPKERKAAPRPRPRPQIIANREAERNVLASIMIAAAGAEDDPEALQALEMLEPGDFYEGKHQLVFAAMQAVHEDGKPFGNPVFITEHLRSTGHLKDAGGQAGVSELTSAVETSVALLSYARTVFDVSLERQTQAIAVEGSQLTIPPDVLADRLRRLVERKQRVEQGGAALPGYMLSEVQKEAVHWAWSLRLAFGKVSGLDGDGGEGKGLITLDLTARASTGRPMPGETDAAPPMNVILIAPEDSAADTIRPRLEAAGGDPSRVRLMAEIQEGSTVRPFTIPRDVELLERTIVADGARLVIIDPIMSCLDAGVKTGIDNDVRAALMPLKQVIERTGAACILVRHFTKASDVRAAYRAGGSVAFTNIARFGWSVMRHPDNPDLRLLMVAKSNYIKPDSHLVYRIEGTRDDAARIKWELGMKVTQDPDALMATHGSAERFSVVQVIEEAGEWIHFDTIRERLAERCEETGEEMPTDDSLRRRLSRYAHAGTIRTKPRAFYAPRWIDDEPSSNKNNLSDVSYLSDVSDVSDVSETQRTVSDIRTVRTPSLQSDILCPMPSESATDVDHNGIGATFTRPSLHACEHPANMRHHLKSGWTCGACNAKLDRASVS